jgi:hypothetical protein
MYKQFEDERTICGPTARFCPAPGSAQRSPWARKYKMQTQLTNTAAMESAMEMHVNVV